MLEPLDMADRLESYRKPAIRSLVTIPNGKNIRGEHIRGTSLKGTILNLSKDCPYLLALGTDKLSGCSVSARRWVPERWIKKRFVRVRDE